LVKLERAFMPSYGDLSPGTVVLFSGRVGDIDISRTAINIKVRSMLELLNIQMPRRLWQSSCTHIFGGNMCLFNRASLQQGVIALTGSTVSAVASTVIPSPSNLFDQGSITGTLGANAGYTRTVTGVAGGFIVVKPQFLFPITPGDLFNMLPGCDRTFSTCNHTFNNAIHFGGMPYIPTPETAA
jgi:uncharacterized phage protein (TIGR02218 family)